MADILEFGKKADSLRSERDLTVRRLKIESLRKFFQCSRCVMKCSKCGVQIESQEYDKFAVPYSFCKPCMQEYQEYRARAEGEPADSDCYWRNSSWMQIWDAWVQYQKAIDQYRQSKEFLQLMDEVEELMKK